MIRLASGEISRWLRYAMLLNAMLCYGILGFAFVKGD